jgi:hypothetical protein
VKRALGQLSCLFFLVSLLLSVAPANTCAQDTAKAGKGARARRAAAPKPRKKKIKKAQRAVEPAEAEQPSETKPAAPAREKRGKTRGRAEAHAGEMTAKIEGGTSSAAALAAQQSAAGVNAQIVKEGAESVKVMEFSGLGIEGRLKSPQLVYFTQRVRAEFERPLLPHRSFMPELEASTAREPVR